MGWPLYEVHLCQEVKMSIPCLSATASSSQIRNFLGDEPQCKHETASSRTELEPLFHTSRNFVRVACNSRRWHACRRWGDFVKATANTSVGIFEAGQGSQARRSKSLPVRIQAHPAYADDP